MSEETVRNHPVDSLWYERFAQDGSFNAYDYLDGDKAYRESQKAQFLAGDVENPSLDYPGVDMDALLEREYRLLALKHDVIEGEPDETVRALYRWRINEKIAELRLLRAVATGDMRGFRRWSEFVYGRPSPEIFAYSLRQMHDTVRSATESERDEVRAAAENLGRLLPVEIPFPDSMGIPSPDIVAQAQDGARQDLSSLVEIELDDRKYDAAEIKVVFEAALRTLDAEGWQVVIDTSSKTGISVDQEHRMVQIPEGRKMSARKLASRISHEIGTHVARRLAGERSRLLLLGLGLDRYEKGEEGIATMRKQAMEGAVEEFAGLEGHLAIGLAYGVDGQPRAFREVFEIFRAHFYLKKLLAGKSPEAAAPSAINDAWNRAVRTFRGTNCRTPGICITKDIVYREGNIGVWEVVRNNPAEMVRFSVGKYDPTNPRHLWALSMLGISDEDLGSE